MAVVVDEDEYPICLTSLHAEHEAEIRGALGATDQTYALEGEDDCVVMTWAAAGVAALSVRKVAQSVVEKTNATAFSLVTTMTKKQPHTSVFFWFRDVLDTVEVSCEQMMTSGALHAKEIASKNATTASVAILNQFAGTLNAAIQRKVEKIEAILLGGTDIVYSCYTVKLEVQKVTGADAAHLMVAFKGLHLVEYRTLVSILTSTPVPVAADFVRVVDIVMDDGILVVLLSLPESELASIDCRSGSLNMPLAPLTFHTARKRATQSRKRGRRDSADEGRGSVKRSHGLK